MGHSNQFRILAGLTAFTLGALAGAYQQRASAAAQAAPKSALIIHSYAPNSWTRGVDLGLSKTNRNYTFSRYYFDSAYWLNQSVEKQKEELQRIIDKILAQKPQLLILFDDEIFEFLKGSLHQLSMHIIASGLNRDSSDHNLQTFCNQHRSLRFILEEFPHQEALSRLASRGKLQSLSLFSPDTITGNLMMSGLRKYLESNRPSVRVRAEIKTQRWELWKTAIKESALQDEVAWIVIPFGLKDRQNQEVPPERVGKWARQNSKRLLVGNNVLGSTVDFNVGLDPIDLGTASGQALSLLPESRCILGKQMYRITEHKHL